MLTTATSWGDLRRYLDLRLAMRRMSRDMPCCDRLACRQPRRRVGPRQRAMRMAEAAHRSTWSSMAMEFDRRIFESCSWSVRTEEPAGAGDDGPAWQTSGAILPPLEEVLLRSRKHGSVAMRQMVVSVRYPIAAHRVGKPDSHSMFDAWLGSIDALRDGGA